MNRVVRFLAWVGFVRIVTDTVYDHATETFVQQPPRVRWPVHVEPWWTWKARWCPAVGRRDPVVGVFRNLPGVIKWERGRLLPRR